MNARDAIVDLVAPLACEVGENPLWHPEAETLFFLDIHWEQSTPIILQPSTVPSPLRHESRVALLCSATAPSFCFRMAALRFLRAAASSARWEADLATAK